MKYVILFRMIAYLSMSLFLFLFIVPVVAAQVSTTDSTRRKIVMYFAHFKRNVASERMSIPRSAMCTFYLSIVLFAPCMFRSLFLSVSVSPRVC